MEEYKFQTKYNWIIITIWLVICCIYIDSKKNDRKNTNKPTVETHTGK
jgi:hypothetical protein